MQLLYEVTQIWRRVKKKKASFYTEESCDLMWTSALIQEWNKNLSERILTKF